MRTPAYRSPVPPRKTPLAGAELSRREHAEDIVQQAALIAPQKLEGRVSPPLPARGNDTDANGRGHASSFASIVISQRSTFDTGQFAFAFSATPLNAAASIPGTLAATSR